MSKIASDNDLNVYLLYRDYLKMSGNITCDLTYIIPLKIASSIIREYFVWRGTKLKELKSTGDKRLLTTTFKQWAMEVKFVHLMPTDIDTTGGIFRSITFPSTEMLVLFSLTV